MELHVTNETLAAIQTTIEWKLRDAKDAVLQAGSLQANVDQLSSYNAVKLNFAAELDTVEKRQSTYFEYSHAENGKVISSSTVLFVKPKHFMFIDPQIQVNISEEDDQFVIRLSTRSFAKYVELELSEADCVFSDNYFDLSAGCEKSIEVRKNRLSLPLTLGEMKRQFRIRSLIDSAS